MPILFTPYKAAVTLLSYAVGYIGAAIITPIIFLLIFLYALDRLLTQLGRTPIERAITLAIAASSPTFLHDALITGPQMAILAFTTLSSTLLLDDRNSHKLMGLSAAGLASSFSPVTALLTILVDLIILLHKKNSWKWISAMVITCIIGVSLIPSEATGAGTGGGLARTLADLGGLGGIPTFTILLAAIGLWILWPRKGACAAIITLWIATFYDSRLISYTNTITICLAGAGITYLIERRWNIIMLKQLSILVIMCGLLFSTISAAGQISRLGPSNDIAESLTWLKGHSRSGQVVLSASENGLWIQYFAVRAVTVDERMTPDDNRTRMADEALNTVYIEKADAYFKSTNTSRIFITPDMMEGKVWNGPEQGLHQLLKDNETFKNAYQSDGIEIYEYLKNYG